MLGDRNREARACGHGSDERPAGGHSAGRRSTAPGICGENVLESTEQGPSVAVARVPRRVQHPFAIQT